MLGLVQALACCQRQSTQRERLSPPRGLRSVHGGLSAPPPIRIYVSRVSGTHSSARVLHRGCAETELEALTEQPGLPFRKTPMRSAPCGTLSISCPRLAPLFRLPLRIPPNTILHVALRAEVGTRLEQMDERSRFSHARAWAEPPQSLAMRRKLKASLRRGDVVVDAGVRRRLVAVLTVVLDLG